MRIAEQYLKKGSKVYIEGQLQTRKWQDQQSGQDRYSTEVVVQGYNGIMQMLGGRSQGASDQMGIGQQQGQQKWGQPQQPMGQSNFAPQQSATQKQPQAHPQHNEPPMDFDDDIPF